MSTGRPALFPDTPRFTYEGTLGTGGMGVVFAAFDHQRGETVALKTLSSTAPNALLRLKREFRAMADLRHPNLVRLHELFEVGGRWFFTMERVPGVDFLQAVRATSTADAAAPPSTLDAATLDSASLRAAPTAPLPTVGPLPDLERLRAAFAGLIAGLERLHARGRFHRDLKPGNVKITPEGRAVILDFGLVRPDSASQPLTADGTVLGTLAYMAPEQATGEPVGAAADWYGVGVMLFEALTGRLPFGGGLADIVDAKLNRPPPDPSDVQPETPSAMARACVGLLARDASRRFGGRAVREALGLPPPAAPAPTRTMTQDLRSRPTDGPLLEGLALADGGQPVVLIIEGDDARRRRAALQRVTAQAGDRGTLSGRCDARERVPYCAVDRLVDGLTAHLSHVADPLPTGDDVAALVARFPVLAGLTDLARLAPLLRDPALDTTPAHAAGAGLRALLGVLSPVRAPVLVLDDVSWGDAASAHVIAGALTVPGAPAPLVVLGLDPARGDGDFLDALLEAPGLDSVAWRRVGAYI